MAISDTNFAKFMATNFRTTVALMFGYIFGYFENITF